MESRSLKAPLLEALYQMTGTLPMHMPGHKRNPTWGPAVSQLSKQGIFDLDFTEVPGLDDLHAPQGAIAEAQELAAECFGARNTYFLVNGASVGIMAAILACCDEGDKVLVPRNAHRCVYEGLVLSGAEPVYFHPGYHPVLEVPVSPSKEQIIELIDREQPRAIVLFNPTYHGVACDFSFLEYAREKGVITIVDESHGSHFIFDNRLPKSSLPAGADIIIHSTHKTLGSLTQTALLHLGTSRVASEAVTEALSLLQTTSPSYVLLASLDAMRRDLANDGQGIVGRSVDLAISLSREISKIEGFSVADMDNPLGHDPTKILLQSSLMNGFEFGAILRRDYGIFPELEDERFVLLMLTVGDTIESTQLLIQALEDIISRRFKGCPMGGGSCQGKREEAYKGPCEKYFEEPFMEPGEEAIEEPWKKAMDTLPEMALTPRQAFKSKKVKRPLSESVGCVSGSLVVPYPPGVPLICPGEGISAEIVEYLSLIINRGSHVQGVFLDGQKPAIWVLEC